MLVGGLKYCFMSGRLCLWLEGLFDEWEVVCLWLEGLFDEWEVVCWWLKGLIGDR